MHDDSVINPTHDENPPTLRRGRPPYYDPVGTPIYHVFRYVVSEGDRESVGSSGEDSTLVVEG